MLNASILFIFSKQLKNLKNFYTPVVKNYDGFVVKTAGDPLIGHYDAHHKVVKGNWEVEKAILEEEGRTSLNHGGHEKFSYLIAHVNIDHGFLDALQKIIIPIFSIVFLSLLMNHFYPSGNYDIYN